MRRSVRESVSPCQARAWNRSYWQPWIGPRDIDEELLLKPDRVTDHLPPRRIYLHLLRCAPSHRLDIGAREL